MLTAPVLAQENNGQAGLLKNMVLDLGWLDRNRMKFKDWWRGMRLFLKNNRIMKTHNRIIAILAHLRGGIASIYAQKKFDKLDEETRTQDWDEFVNLYIKSRQYLITRLRLQMPNKR